MDKAPGYEPGAEGSSPSSGARIQSFASELLLQQDRSAKRRVIGFALTKENSIKIYLAGPMTGLKKNNFPAFNRIAKKLRKQGHTVFNPADNGEGEGLRGFFMYTDISQIMGSSFEDRVDIVALLRAWEKSRGARLEIELALQLDIPVVWADTFEPLTQQQLYKVLEEECPSYMSLKNEGVKA